MKHIVVLITTSTQQEAGKIANGLIDNGVAACVNIVPKVKSIFVWQGKKEVAEECLLIAKTKKASFKRLRQIVKRLHSYTVPEIISVAITQGDKEYLNWISETVR